MAGTDSLNLLWDPLENYMLRPFIAETFSKFKPLPDAAYLQDPFSNWLYHQNGYNAGFVSARDASFDRRIARLKENAARYNISAAFIDSHGWAIRLLMQSDTPETQEFIRTQLGWMGERLLDAFHDITAYEPGELQLYPSIANTYGSPIGNEGAVHFASYASSLIRNQKPNEIGLRKFDAGSLSTWLRLEQENGFNFEIAAGLNQEGVQSYNQVFSNTFGSAEHSAARSVILGSYAEDLASRASSATDKKILNQIRKNALAGKTGDELYSGLQSFYGAGKEYADLQALRDNFNIEGNVVAYAQTSQANISDRVIREAIKKNGELRASFEAYAADKNVTLDGSENEKHLVAQFVRDVQTGAYTQGISGSTYDTVSRLYQSVEAQLGEQYRVGHSIIEQKGYETNLFQGVGQASWNALSPEEKQRYEQMGGGTSGGQVLLGKDMTEKYAHESMRYFDYNKAVYDTQRLMSSAALAGLSSDNVSKQYAFIGSIIKDKDLTGIAARASMAWQASAKAHGIRLREEDRIEANQRYARMMNSIEGDTYAMFLSQEFDPNSNLGKLKDAVLSGNLTADQEKQLQDYFRKPGKLLDDVARETKKNPEVLSREARLSKAIWENMGGDQTENALGAMERQFRKINNARLASMPNVQMSFRSMSTLEKEKLGIGKGGVSEERFQEMVHNIIQDGSVNVNDWAVGNISETTIKKLRERGLTAEADYAQQRADQLSDSIAGYESTGKSTPEAVRLAKDDLGQMVIAKRSAAVFRDPNAAKIQGRTEFDMTDRSFLTKDKNGNAVRLSAAEMNDKMTTMKIKESGVQKAPEDMTPEERALKDKNAAEAEALADQVVGVVKNAVTSPLDALNYLRDLLTGGGKKNKPAETAGSKDVASGKKTSDTDSLVAALKNPELNSAWQLIGEAIAKNVTINVTVQEA